MANYCEIDMYYLAISIPLSIPLSSSKGYKTGSNRPFCPTAVYYLKCLLYSNLRTTSVIHQ